ncbi:amino acid adenylation domain-containing protein [Nocardiopsis mangrovi]|uniref:Phenyloxazoline synthase MbtB n=1 Tax=Nocardiopsis mangrovi TaxID=1179818 RepID=A0ABV9E285_9ACTN
MAPRRPASPYPPAVADPANRFEPFPLTDQQQAYLLGRTGVFELGNVSTHAYYEYEGELDVERFTLAWRRAVARHDVLRAVVLPDEGRQQVLADPGEFTPEIVDLRGTDPAPALREVRERLSHEVRPADVWPLFAVVVSRLDDRRSRVHVSFDALVLDYLSWQLLIADLTRFYDDPGLDLPPLEIGYRDYVLAEAAMEGTDRHRRARDYWHERLPGLPPAPRLPLAEDPATVRRPRWTSRIATLPAPQWTRVKAQAAAAGLTPTSVCLAAFAEVLAVWSDSAHFTLNVPRMNRFPLHPRANELLGEFASFSLLEVDLRDPDATFTDRARRLQRTFWNDLAHQEYSGVRVLRELVRASGGANGALMPVVLTSTIGFTAGERPLLGHVLPRVFAISQTPQVYLDVQIEETAAGLVYNFDAVAELLPPALADRLFAAFGTVLGRLTDSGGWSATGFDLVPPGDHARGGLHGPAREIPGELVQDGFLRHAAADPGATAVITPTVELTYGELHRRAAGLARELRAAGARTDAPVAVVLEKGWEQVVAAYGVLLSGAPYLPIDAGAPEERIRAVVEQAGAEQVIDAAAFAGLTASAATADSVDSPGPSATTADGHRGSPGDLAYVLFTSGSTGRPKGVMVEHRGMVNALHATREEFGVGPADTCLAVTALHHDMSAFDLFGVLGAGGTVVVPDAGRSRDAAHWAELIDAHGVTLWNSVPAMMEMLMESGAAPRSLRAAFLGGDWVPPRLVATLRERAPGAEVVSVGGPTETTLWNIWHRVRPEDLERPSIPYGRPIANTAYHVLDERGADRPDGVVGELYCAGPGVARGYWDDPERTAASFVVRGGTRLYRTGDLGRVLPDGSIEFAGRADAQVKVRGMRIEPGEVEAVLGAQPGVEAAVVVGVPHEGRPGHRALAAYVTGSADPDAVRAAARAALPEHLVPATVTVLAALPLTANGKVDRAALESGAPSPRGGGTEAFTAPRTPLEATIAQEWAEVLGAGPVGASDDFFVLGGDSVTATRVLAGLRDALESPDLPLMALFAGRTVAGMAAALLSAEAEPGRLARVAELYQQVLALSDDEVESELAT